MRNCQRCTTGEVSWTSDTVELIGNVHANLCPECITEHSGVIQNHPAWDEGARLDARHAYLDSLAEAGSPATEDQWVELIRDKRRLALVFREISLEFVKPIPARTETP